MKKRHRPPRKPGATAAPAGLGGAGLCVVDRVTTYPSGASAAAGLQSQPYKDDLWVQARALWRRGDWAELARTTAEDIENHPQRAKLALLVAAAHQALDQPAATRLYAGLARQWGCESRLLAAVLVAGVYNTLGRAAAATGKQRERTLRFFHNAVAIGLGGSVERLVVQARIDRQLRAIGLTTELAALQGPVPTETSALALRGPLQSMAEQFNRQVDSVAAGLKAQRAELAQTKRQLEHALRTEIVNATRQIEAHSSVQAYLSQGQLLPALHGWPVSPDFALLLIELLETHDFDLVIEFGSGVSTRLIAQTLANIAARRARPAAAVQVAYEHLTEYHAQTAAQLAQVGLAASVRLVHAPLAPFVADDGQTYPYYDCQRDLEAVRGLVRSTALPPRVLVLVDGPPAATGPQARYPALAAVIGHLGGASLSLLLDDYAREDEKQIAERWLQELRAAGLSPRLDEWKLEKGACLISCELQRQITQEGSR